ncbi:hypothetical protein HALLA_13300 [Halostagnicola larsenii XH-48]|uniref:DUF4352 domain-containing protein n=1 Tax=Halostagnicola larsenii XH-48 TaxID=797299 RepID=W0JQY9_9EURY|nr:hypothetical protein [Halostagnicola larsenii]AHG01019.1 hypothetical protein HALLA_13300 [Halostagnicola larsenii XH-48]
MDRRTFVAGTATTVALTAGCLASGESRSDDDPSNGSNDDESDDSKKDPSAEQRPYTVVGDETIGGSPVQHEVTVVDGDLHSPDSPLRVEVTVTNTSDETLTYGERRETLFWGNRSENGFTLLPELDSETTSTIREFDTESEYWVATSPFATTTDYQVGTLEPDESRSETLSVVVSHQEEPPENPPTEMSFNTRFRAPADVGSETESQPSEWGFTLSLDGDTESYVADGDEAVREFPLQYTVDLAQAQMQSPDEPMQVEVSLTNESDQRVQYGERRTAMFWNARDDGFVLYPEQELPDENYERDADSGLWVAEGGFGMTMDYQFETLEPGETRSETLLVLVQPDETEEIRESLPSELSFETPLSITQLDGESVDDVSTNWGFALQENAE